MPGDNTFQHFSTSTSNGLSRHRQQAPQPTVQSQFEQLQRHHQEHNEQLLQLTRDNSDPDARFRSMAYTPLPLEYEQQQQQRSPPPASYSTPSSPHGSLVALLREQQLQAAESNSLRLGERREDNTEETQSNASEEGSRSRSRRNSSSSESSVSQTRHPSTASVSSRKATSASPRPSVKARQQVTKAAKAIAASTNSTARKAATSGEATATGPAVSGEKRSRYLREIDRRSIIHRIDRGEKQSELAKEFGVTRAAISHINKNRVEILTRSTRADVHSGARHPKRGMYTTSASAAFSSPGPTAGLTATAAPADNQPSASVFEVRSLAMGLILTTLRRRETEAREFQNSAERAVRLLLEEALARVPTRSVDVTTPIDYVCEGRSVVNPTCGVSISEDGFALLQVFRSIQPTSPSGFISLNATAIHEGMSCEPTLQKVCVPPDLRAYDVFLLEATCAMGAGACVAIQALLDFGAREAAISLVCVLASTLAVSEVCSRFPAVRIVTGAVDPEISEGGGGDAMICPGLGNFTERYFDATVVRHTSLGANVDL